MPDLSRPLPGMVPASYRGLPFYAPDTATEVGRRVAEHLFPGTDIAGYDDHGLLPDLISMPGILVGDDYALQAKIFEKAFKKAGPAMLIHPWHGPMTVILTEPAEITLDSTELRVARFVASFKRVQAGARPSTGTSTASALLSASSALSLAAGVLGGSIATTALSAVRSRAVGRGFRLFSGIWKEAAGVRDGVGAVNSVLTAAPAIGGRASSLIAAAIPTVTPADAAGLQSAARTMSDTLINLVPDLADEPAIAAAADAPPTPAGIPATLASAAAIHAGNGLVEFSADAPSPTDRVVLIAAAGEAYAAAARISIAIEHNSRKDAQVFRRTFTDGLDVLTAAIEPLATTGYGMPASALARSVSDLKTAVITDINEVIGRLPAVLVFDLVRDLDAAQLAQHVYGDTPELLEAGYRAIVARNRPKHPARLPAGPVEVLK